MLTVRKATLEDAVSMTPNLREADLTEIYAVNGDAYNPEEALRLGINSPDGCYVAVDQNDEPQLIFGTCPSGDPMVGFVWMMATDGLITHKAQLFKETPKWLHKIGAQYPILTNLVHAENQAHIRWLQWAGFIILRDVHYNEHTFYEFARLMTQAEMERNHNV